VCVRGREARRVGIDPDARDVQAVGVPAHADGRIARDLAVRVELDRVTEQIEALVPEDEPTRRGKLARVGRRPLAVTGS